MSEKKVQKYLGYALGEILLVVIGILIALSINNANQRRIDKEALEGHLKSIALNIQSDIQKAKFINAKRSQVLSRIDYVITNLSLRVNKAPLINNIIGTDYSKEDVTFVSKLLSQLRDFNYLNPNTSGFESLKNSSHLSKLQGKDIGNLLSAYYNLAEQLKFDESIYNQRLERSITELRQADLVASRVLYYPDFGDWSNNLEDFRPKFAEVLNHNSTSSLMQVPISLLVEFDNLILMGETLIRLIDMGLYEFDETSQKNIDRVFNKFENTGYSKLLINGYTPEGYYSALEAFSQPISTPSMNRFYFGEIESNFPGMDWGVFYYYVGSGSVEDLATRDFSSYDTLRLELKGKLGGEKVQISIKDETNPTDGSESKVPLTLTNEWKVYNIPLSKFEGTNLKKLFMPAAIIFQGEPVTASVKNIEYIK
ncbi:MAG: hypothetical protein Roseis2KO_41870 [Roseivirga sp.]